MLQECTNFSIPIEIKNRKLVVWWSSHLFDGCYLSPEQSNKSSALSDTYYSQVDAEVFIREFQGLHNSGLSDRTSPRSNVVPMLRLGHLPQLAHHTTKHKEQHQEGHPPISFHWGVRLHLHLRHWQNKAKVTLSVFVLPRKTMNKIQHLDYQSRAAQGAAAKQRTEWDGTLSCSERNAKQSRADNYRSLLPPASFWTIRFFGDETGF